MRVDEVTESELDAIEPGILQEIGNPVPVTLAATVVYVPLAIVGGLLAIFWQETLPGPDLEPAHLLGDLGIGVGVALALVLVDWALVKLLPPFRELGAEFAKVLGPLSGGQIVYLALLSGVAEEVCFRGVIQPLIGLVPTSILFGLLHVVPSRAYLPVTVFALVVGFVCGWVFQERQSLVAPIVIHALVNGVNIHVIVSDRTRRRGAAPGGTA